MNINWIQYTKSEFDFYFYTRNHQQQCLKSSFEFKIIFEFVSAYRGIHKGYHLVKKMVLNDEKKLLTI